MSANKSHDKSADKRRENDDRNARDSSPKEVLRCKLFGGKHRAAKKSCPAFGKRYSACGKMNHFASQCLSTKRVSVVESESESEPDECLTWVLLPLVQPKIYQKLLAEKERQATGRCVQFPLKFATWCDHSYLPGILHLLGTRSYKNTNLCLYFGFFDTHCEWSVFFSHHN